jgi:hypothetical protein
LNIYSRSLAQRIVPDHGYVNKIPNPRTIADAAEVRPIISSWPDVQLQMPTFELKKNCPEIVNRWLHVMNERLEVDINLRNEFKFGKQYSIPPRLVLDTWRGTLMDDDKLPKDWLRQARVLVGMASRGSQRSPPPIQGVG